MVKRNAGRVQGSVRIIAGEWRGRRIAIPDGTAVRPTPDRVRETVFNWLRDSHRRRALPRSVRRHGRARLRGVVARCGGGLVRRAGCRARRRRCTRPRSISARRRTSCAAMRSRSCASRRPRLSTSCSSTRRMRSRSIRCSSCCRAGLAPQALVYVERPRSAGLPAVPAAEWLKQSYAGAVEYGLLRFEEATMPRQSPSEAHSP